MMPLLFWCLASLTNPSLADAIVGDLQQGRHNRRRRSPLAVTVWFWRTGLGILFSIAGGRLREALASLGAVPGGGNGLGGDLRQALRTLCRRPGFATAVIVLLALGIGANTAVFSIVHAVVLKPLPYRDLDRLVYVWRGPQTNPGNRHSIQTGSRIHEIARLNTTFESFAVTKPWDTSIEGIVDVMLQEGSERLRGASVTPNFFELLGVSAAIGRTFASSDDDAAPVAVISHALWVRMFGGDPHVLGSRLRLARGTLPRSEPAYTIVGVLPRDVAFTYPRETEIYLLLPWTRIAPSSALEYTVVARLREGVTVKQAEAEMTTIAVNLLRVQRRVPDADLPALVERNRALVEPMQDHVAAEVRPGVLLLAGVAALVLIIACVNIALLALASSVDRTGELAVRAALGAGPRRIARLLLVENIVLTVIGTAAGIGLAAAILPLIRTLLPEIVPRADQIRVDLRVVMFACAVSATATILSGILPVILTIRRDLLAVVKRSGPTTAIDPVARWWRSAVIVLQVSVVLVLLVGAGLLINSFWRLQRVDLGFSGDDLVAFETRFYNPAYRQKGRVAAFEQRLLAQVRALPGVEAVSISTAVPMRGVDFRAPEANLRAVTPEFFAMLRIPVRAGRVFTDADRAGSPRVMVVSESYARLKFGDENPLGRHLEHDEQPHEIIGVVGDVRYAEVVRDPAPAFYLARAQSPNTLICLIVKARPGMRAAVAASLRGAVRAIDPEQPIEGVTTIAEIISESTADRRFYAFATGAFGSIAMALAVAGLFGAVSRSVLERRRELAIRTAGGADSRQIVRLVLGYGLGPVVMGASIGTLAAVSGSRVLQRFLFQVPPTDAPTYAAAVGLVLLVAAAACLIPARRALHFQPAALLRE